MDNEEIRYGIVTICLPDALSRSFYIFQDLTGPLGCEYQIDAEALLKEELKKIEDFKPKPDIDCESDYTDISSSNAVTILKIAHLINQLAGNPQDQDQYDKTLDILKNFKPPKRKRWQVGDIFGFKLENNTYMFGQVVGTHLTKTSPTLSLYELNKKSSEITVEELNASRVISILHTDGFLLAKGIFMIKIKKYEILTDPDSGPWGKCKIHVGQKTGSDSHIKDLANAYYGLIPWNVMYDEDYYDKKLMQGIKRPLSASILSPLERKKWRKEYDNEEKINIDNE